MAKRRSNRVREYELERDLAAIAPVALDAAKFVSNPNRFYGKMGDDFEKWLREFERCARANHWSNERLVEILPSLLRDRASDIWEELPNSAKEDYEQLTSALSQQFMPQEARRLYYGDLYTRRQGESESVDEFSRSIQILTRRAYADMPATHQDTLMREHFISGLRKSIQRLLNLKDPETFSEAVRVAKGIEYNDEYVDGKAPWLKATEYAPPAPANSAPTVHMMQQGPPSLESRLEKIEKMLDRMQMSRGNADEVYQERGRYSQRGTHGRGGYSQLSGRNLRASTGQPICNQCSKVGHYKRECPETKKPLNE
eukprot:Seg753.4 transcript_id=Seg753.4/GoldUCD/mRNA.D3Y31 product="hypothetical protein" protein_id=Seg753.4/GoldUCD/D3Y31